MNLSILDETCGLTSYEEVRNENKENSILYLMYLPLVVALIALSHLPEKIPSHYGFDNQIDRCGNKYETLKFPRISLLMGYFLLGMVKLAAKKIK